MKYLKNNSKPQKITVRQQRKIEYFGPAVKGRFTRHLLYIAMHPVGFRSGGELLKDDPDGIDQKVLRENLPMNEKIIISHKGENLNSSAFDVRDYRYTSEQRRPLNYTFDVEHYSHIVGFPLGADRMDERRYTLLVGDIVKFESDGDADEIMQRYPFVDEVNEKGEIIKSNPYMDKIDKEPMDTRGKQITTKWEEVPREDFAKKYNIKEAPTLEYREEKE